jgi:hypothetical protein
LKNHQNLHNYFILTWCPFKHILHLLSSYLCNSIQVYISSHVLMCFPNAILHHKLVLVFFMNLHILSSTLFRPKNISQNDYCHSPTSTQERSWCDHIIQLNPPYHHHLPEKLPGNPGNWFFLPNFLKATSIFWKKR